MKIESFGSVSVDRETKSQIDRLAAQENRTRGEIVRAAIAAYIAVRDGRAGDGKPQLEVRA